MTFSASRCAVIRFLPRQLGTLLCLSALSWGAFAQVDVSATAGTPAASYTTLKGAFDAINLGTHQGVIGIAVNGNTTETAPAVLNASLGASSYSAITISPTGGASRTISGAIAAGSPLIDFNGADNVTIDGLNSGGNSLTIANTTISATSGTSTVRFIGGATNNTITNANVQGSGTMSVATNGAVIFFSTDALTANGNDNNTISNNNIGPAGVNLPTKGILGNGSTTNTAIGNSGNIINNNNIFDYFGAAVTSAGVATNGGCNTWTITNNRFYQTGTRTWTTGALHNAINIGNTAATSGAQGFTITGNTIGFASNTQTGTYSLTGAGAGAKFIGILFNGISTGTTTNVSNNTVAGVSMTGVTGAGSTTASPFTGILFQEGNGITISNAIGSQSANGSLVFSTTTTSATDVYGIFNFSSNAWISNSNNIGGISVTNLGASGTFLLYGMRAFTASTTAWTANSNRVGGTIANSIQLTGTGNASQVVGMFTSNAPAALSSNVVRNLTTNIGTGTSTGASVIGINVTTATPNHTLSQNTISNLSNSNATAASVVTGIQFTGSTANVVERNMISGLSVATDSNAAEVNGIRVAGGTTIYRNNVIAIGAGIANAIGTGSTTGGVNGINEPLGTDSFFHNSVFIGGAPTAGVGPSFAFNSSQTTNTRSFRNNIFFNGRSNSGATGKNFAVRVGGSAPNPSGLTVNNNVYFANGTGGVFGFFNALDVANLAAWKVAVGQDSASFESNPQYNDPSNATPDLHIHPSNATVVEANGVDVGVTNDFDGQARAGLTPTDIGADAGNFVGADASPPAISYTLFSNTAQTSDRTLSVTISDVTGVASGGLAPRSYYRKGAGSYFSQACSLNSGTVNNGTWNCTINHADLGGVVGNDVVGYFVIAQDSLGNLSSNPAGAVATNVNTVTTPPAAPNTYTIVPSYSGPIDVGAGQTFTSLTNAGGIFEAINAGTLSANTTINITSDLTGELGTVALNQWAEDGVGGYTLLIRPSGGPRTITGSNAGALIRLNGADRVTIDGSTTSATATGIGGNAAIRELTIQNTNVGTSATVVSFGSGVNGAQNDTIRNVNILGQDPLTSLLGISLGGTAPGTAGTDNDNNRVENCSVKRVVFGIYSAGASLANQNTGTVIRMNETSALTGDRIRRIGILAFNEAGIQINENSINGVSSSDEADAIGIALGTQAIDTTLTTAGGVTGALVSRNKIDGVASLSAAGFSAAGITVAGAVGGANAIQNNMISGVTAPSTSPDIPAGIYVVGAAGSSTRLLYNSVSMSGDRGAVAGQTPSFAVAITGTDPTVEIKDNAFSTTQVASGGGVNAKSYAIGMVTTTFANLDANYNDYFSSGANAGFFRSGGLGAATGTDYATVALWAAAVADDANSLQVDPLFVSTSDPHLQQSSPLRAAGTPLAGITVDFDNQTRSVTTPAIGADELVSDLSITKTDGASTATPGTPVTYTIVASNVGPSDASNVTVADTFTAFLSGCSTTAVAAGGATGVDPVIVGNITDSGITLPVGGSATYTATCNISAGATGSLSNTATVSGGNDSNLANNSATDTDTLASAIPNLSINDVSLNEGNAGTTSYSFTVSLSTPAGPGGVNFFISTQDDSAVAPGDYTSKFLAGQTIPEGSSTYTFEVLVNGDTSVEPNEAFFVNVFKAFPANITDGQGVGTIINDDSADTPPTISDVINQTTNEDTATGAIAFTVGDAETAVGALTVSGTSSDTTLVPNANLVFGGSGANRTVTISPAANLSGSSTITLTVSDGALTSSDTFSLKVDPVNDLPSFVKGSDQSQPSGTNTAQTVAGWATAISDGDPEAAQVLTFNVSNSNNGLFTTQPTVDSTSGTLNYTPNGTSGSATVSVSLTDDANAGGAALTSAIQTFTITISANTAPTISDILDQSTNEDTATGAIAFTIGDAETAVGSLTVSGTSSNTTLVPNGNLVFAGSGANRTVTITPAANLSGTSTITVTVNDGTADTSDTFLLTVVPVNDLPSFTAGGNQSHPSGTNTAQTVVGWATAINDGDPEVTQTLTFNVSNNNNGLFTTQPTVNSTTGTLSYTPNGTSGSATVSVSLTDDEAAGGAALTSAIQTFTITVSANTAPTISDILNQSTNEDTATSAIAFTVGDAETAVGSLTVSGTSSNTTLIPDANLVFGGSGANRSVTITPAANLSGTSTITVTVNDGTTTTSDTFLLTVNAVNDTPSFVKGADQSHPFGTNTAQTVAGWATAISDGDPEVTQTLIFNVSNNNNGLFTTQPTVNSTTGTLNYTPNGTAGSATVNVSLTDDEAAGGAALTSAVQTFTITVSANTPPTISDILDRSTNEDTATSAIAFTIGDAETAVGSLTVSGTSSNTTLVPNGNLVFAGSGANRTVTITPAANLSGTSTITVTVNDGTADTSDTFLLTVVPVNDLPSFTAGGNQSHPSGTNTAQTVVGWATAINDGDPEVTQTLIFNVSNNNNGLFTTQPTVNSTTGTLSYTPNGTAGSATVSVSLTDDEAAGGAALTSAVQTFTITVSANTAPTISDILDQSTNEDTATGAIAFTIGDAETAVGSLTVSGTSSNTTLIPDANLVFAGVGPNRSVTITPAANLSGTSTITVTVNDGTTTTSDTFLLTVNAVNDTPSFVKGADQSHPFGTNTAQTVAGWATAISDGDPEVTQTLIFNVSNNNNGLFTTQPTVNSTTGTLNYTPNGTAGSATVNVSLTDDEAAGGAALTSAVQTFTITVAPNTPPVFTVGAAIARQQGSPGSVASLGVVSDAPDAAGSLSVAAIAGGTGSGFTINALTNSNGAISGSVAASCNAVAGTQRFQVTDSGGLTGTGDLQVNVSANTGPSLSYAAQNVGVGNGLSVSPTAAPSDNGTVVSVLVQSPGSYTGSISVNSAGVITLSNAQPAGLHTLTIRSTDNCGLSTDSTVGLTVGQASTFKLISASVTPSRFGEAVTFSVQVAGVNPTGSVTFFNGATNLGTGLLTASPSGGANLKLASLTVSSLPLGDQTIRATYAGDINNAASTSQDLPHSVVAAGTRITLTPAANPAAIGNSTVAIQVSPEAPGGGVPQGQVTLTGGAVNCTAMLVAGAASCSLNLSTLGYQAISASYLPSNGNHTASTGSTAVVVLGASGSTDLRVRIGNGVRNIDAGQLISYQIVVDNLGSEAAVGRLQVPVSADFTGASYSCLSDGQASCGTRAGTGNIDSDVSLAPGGVLIYTLTLNAPLAPERTLSQGASVSIRAPSTDPDLSNNSAEDIDPMGLLSDGFEEPSVIE